jgi:hypothetical protein
MRRFIDVAEEREGCRKEKDTRRGNEAERHDQPRLELVGHGLSFRTGSIPGASNPIAEYTELEDQYRVPMKPPLAARRPLTMVEPTG